jgi:SpoVK/Ycf46/Vps4 family AAA+-type ATPase
MTDIKKYKKLLKEKPNDSETHFMLANEYRRLSYFQQAIHHYKESIRIKPTPAVQSSLGFLHLELKQFPEAIKHFTQILRANPADSRAHNGLGETSLGMKHYKEAIQHFAKAIEIEPAKSVYHYNLGKAFQKLECYADAVNKYRQALKLDPSNSSARFYMGFAYCKLERYQEAVQEFREVLKLESASAEAYSNLGFALSAMGIHQEAVNAYKEAIRINPNLPEVYSNLDEVYQKMGNKSTSSSTASVTVAVEKSHGLSKVAGMQSLKRMIYEEIIRPIRDPELYNRFRLSLPNGILLYGPPGCGKTFISKQLAEELGWHFLEIRGSTVGSIYIHGTALAIRDTFAEAEKNAPTLLFIDEFEGLVPKRSELSGSTQHKAEEVNEFLIHLNECAMKKIFVIAATNEPNKIDEAVRRPGRLDKMIFVGPPDLEARIESLRMCLADRPVENIDITRYARMLDGYPYSDISNIANEAARLALRGGDLFISNEHVAEAIRRNPSSLTATALSRYKSFQQRGI